MHQRILRSAMCSNSSKFIAGGFTVGIPLYLYHLYTTRITQSNQTNVSINNNDVLETSFKTRFLYKLYHLDFSEIRRTEVLIELILLSTPAIFAGIVSYKTYFTQSMKWKRKHFYNSVNVSLNTIIPNKSRFNMRVRTILETNINNIVPNDKAIKIITNAAKRTTVSQPFIIIDDDETRKSIRNLFKDHIIQLSNQTFIAQDLLNNMEYGIIQKYIMFMTLWPQTSIGPYQFNQKIRIQLIKKESIRHLIKEIGTTDQAVWNKRFDGFFKDRWYLLQFVANQFNNEERNNFILNKNKYISQVELAMIDPTKFEKMNIDSTDRYFMRDDTETDSKLLAKHANVE